MPRAFSLPGVALSGTKDMTSCVRPGRTGSRGDVVFVHLNGRRLHLYTRHRGEELVEIVRGALFHEAPRPDLPPRHGDVPPERARWPDPHSLARVVFERMIDDDRRVVIRQVRVPWWRHDVGEVVAAEWTLAEFVEGVEANLAPEVDSG